MDQPTIDELLRAAGRRNASDLSRDPQDDGSLLAMARIDGVRQPIGHIPASAAA